MTLNDLAKRCAAGLPPRGSRLPRTGRPCRCISMLPWSRFCNARLVGEELMLTFSDVDVVIRGQNLALMVKEFAGLSIETLRPLPAEYRSIIPVTESFISEIAVIPTTSD